MRPSRPGRGVVLYLRGTRAAGGAAEQAAGLRAAGRRRRHGGRQHRARPAGDAREYSPARRCSLTWACARTPAHQTTRPSHRLPAAVDITARSRWPRRHPFNLRYLITKRTGWATKFTISMIPNGRVSAQRSSTGTRRRRFPGLRIGIGLSGAGRPRRGGDASGSAWPSCHPLAPRDHRRAGARGPRRPPPAAARPPRGPGGGAIELPVVRPN